MLQIKWMNRHPNSPFCKQKLPISRCISYKWRLIKTCLCELKLLWTWTMVLCSLWLEQICDKNLSTPLHCLTHQTQFTWCKLHHWLGSRHALESICMLRNYMPWIQCTSSRVEQEKSSTITSNSIQTSIENLETPTNYSRSSPNKTSLNINMSHNQISLWETTWAQNIQLKICVLEIYSIHNLGLLHIIPSPSLMQLDVKCQCGSRSITCCRCPPRLLEDKE